MSPKRKERFNQNKSDELDDLEKKILEDDWTFYDKLVYGGLGYGSLCLPTHVFDVVLTVIFPPLGLLIKNLDFLDYFPYIHWGTLAKIIDHLDELVNSIILTALFYVPGLIYSLNKIKCEDLKIKESYRETSSKQKNKSKN